MCCCCGNMQIWQKFFLKWYSLTSASLNSHLKARISMQNNPTRLQEYNVKVVMLYSITLWLTTKRFQQLIHTVSAVQCCNQFHWHFQILMCTSPGCEFLSDTLFSNISLCTAVYANTLHVWMGGLVPKNPTISSYRHRVRWAIVTNSNIKFATVTELLSWLTKAIG